MKRIFKYPLVAIDVQNILMPEGAKMLSVQAQNGEACLWVEVDDNRPQSYKAIYMHGTGQPLDHFDFEAKKYIGTVQLFAGKLVLHVYAGGEK